VPSRARYARERAAAAARGTTPYRERVQTVRKRDPGVTLDVVRGHADKPAESLTARRRRRDVRQAFGEGPNGWCVVCGSRVEPERPNSYTDRRCGNEQVKRFRHEGAAWISFRGLAKLAADKAWVRQRRRESRGAGVPLRRPRGVTVD
jgi:hypothetical protein